MYTSLSIFGTEISLHEVLQLTADIVKAEAGEKPSACLDPLECNEIIEELQESVTGLIPENPILVVPAHMGGLKTPKHWLYVAKHIAKHKKTQDIQGWWLIVAERLIHIDLADMFWYVSDHGPLSEVIPVVSMGLRVDLLSMLEGICAAANMPLLQLRKQKEFYICQFSHPPESSEADNDRVLYLYINADKHLCYSTRSLDGPQQCSAIVSESELGKSCFKSIYFKCQNKRLGSYLTPDEMKQLLNVGRKNGHTISGDDYVNYIDEQFRFDMAIATVAGMDCNINEWKQIWQYACDVYFAMHDELTERIKSFKDMCYAAYNTDTVKVSKDDKDVQVSFLTNRFVMAEIAKEVNSGKREMIYHSVQSYGDPLKGDAYFEFAEIVRNYLDNDANFPPGFTVQERNVKLAQEIRKVLTGEIRKALDPCPNDLLFLPNLVVAWFVAEGARNQVGVLTTLMLIDLMEISREAMDSNHVNRYGGVFTLIHPFDRAEDNAGDVSDAYGVGITLKPQHVGKGVKPSFYWGGSQSMSHLDSSGQGNKGFQKNQKLNIAQQKDGMLLIDWLFCCLQPYVSELALSSPLLPYPPDYDDVSSSLVEVLKLNKRNVKREPLKKKLLILHFLIKPLVQLRLECGIGNLLNSRQNAIKPIVDEFLSINEYYEKL